MKKPFFLFALAIIVIVGGCNDSQFTEPTIEIKDQMLIDLNTAIVNNLKNVDESKAKQLMAGYDSFDDFMAKATKSELNQLVSIYSFNDPIVEEIFGKKYSKADFSLKERFLKLNVKSDPNGREAENCDEMCTAYAMEVWWDRFHALQDLGADMYEAASYANAARSDAYSGCMFGCTNGGGGQE